MRAGSPARILGIHALQRPTTQLFEREKDGWRVIVSIEDELVVRTRTGRSITPAVPEVAAIMDGLAGHRVVLDGELVAGQGRPEDFYRLAPRLSASKPRTVRRLSESVPLTVFDILHLDGQDLTGAPYEARRARLEDLAVSGRNWCTVASYRDDGLELLASCAELDLEGIVAKRIDSPYRAGARSRDWIKVKTPMWLLEHAPRRHERSAATAPH